VVGDIDQAAAERTVATVRETGGEAVARRFDAGDETSVRDLIAYAVDEFGCLDGLHNNVADMSLLDRDTDAATVPSDIWERTLRVNLTGVLLGIRYAVPAMLERGAGSIVNTSSDAAYIGDADLVAYGVAKAGVNALTRHVATRWGKRGIRCNAVAPGMVMTEANADHAEGERGQAVLEVTRSPRLGRPEDIAAMVALLLSDDAGWVNGQIYGVDGGLLLR
jgi:NAD(P)-dependent dehydrogenase (short-subunit alcohol dehydrogenase family)